MTADAIQLHQPALGSKVFRNLQNTMALAELGCRAQLINQLTRVGIPIVRSMIAKAGGLSRDFGGRKPRALDAILKIHTRHIEMSQFLRAYVRATDHFDDVTNEVHTDSFVRGLILLQSVCKDGELTPDHAHMAAAAYHAGELKLTKCGRCQADYAVTAAEERCPHCLAMEVADQNLSSPSPRKPLTSSRSVLKPNAAIDRPTPDVEETTRASDHLGTLRHAIALAELGARPQMIQRMTAAGMPTIRAILKLLGKNDTDRGGRHPRAITTLLEHVPRHTESSLFLNYYIRILGHYGGGRGVVHCDSFIRALMMVKSEMKCPEFTPDVAHLVASLYHGDEITQRRCTHCQNVFLAGKEHQIIRAHITVGDCPLCREVMTMQTGRTVVRIPDAREQRAMLSKFSDA